ncbi:MAG: hypothetical protein U0H96_07020 [Christensenellales bacterium]|nr:hypothetical protein [Christensenellales bacterium]
MISLHVSYRYLLIIVLVAALLCLMPARGADAPNEKKPQTAAAQSVESAEAPAGADLSAQTNRETYLHRTLYYAPCGHSVQRREKLPAQLVGLTRSVLEKEIGGLYENAAVTGFSAGEVDITTRMDMPCPLHWVLRGGEDGLLAVWQNTTGEALSVVRKTDIPVTAAAEEEQDELRDGRMFDDVQALEGYLESLSS